MSKEKVKDRSWESAAIARGLIPQPHGGALMPGGGYRPRAGRPKSVVKLALEQAKGDPLRQLTIARQCFADDTLPFSERLRAIYFTLRLARLDRQEHRGAVPTFRVVGRSPAEMNVHPTAAAKAAQRVGPL
jgi:hypothetical protein